MNFGYMEDEIGTCADGRYNLASDGATQDDQCGDSDF